MQSTTRFSGFVFCCFLLLSSFFVSLSFGQLESPPTEYVCCDSNSYQYEFLLDGTTIDWVQSTIEVWVAVGNNPSSVSPPVNLVWKGDIFTTNTPVALYWSNPYLIARGAFRSGGPGFAGAVPLQTFNAEILWRHLAVRRSGTSIVLFVDGVQVSSWTGSFLLEELDNSLPFTICRNPAVLVMTEVRIWNVSLSDDEIALRWNTRLNGNEPFLLHYWPLTSDLSSGNGGSPLTSVVGIPSFSTSASCSSIISSLVVTPSVTPTMQSPTRTRTPTRTPSITLSLTPSSSVTPSASPSESITPTSSLTPTQSSSGTVSITPTATSTFSTTSTNTPSASSSSSNTLTLTITPTRTITTLPSLSVTSSRSISSSGTSSKTLSNTPTLSESQSRTPTVSRSQLLRLSRLRVPSISALTTTSPSLPPTPLPSERPAIREVVLQSDGNQVQVDICTDPRLPFGCDGRCVSSVSLCSGINRGAIVCTNPFDCPVDEPTIPTELDIITIDAVASLEVEVVLPVVLRDGSFVGSVTVPPGAFKEGTVVRVQQFNGTLPEEEQEEEDRCDSSEQEQSRRRRASGVFDISALRPDGKETSLNKPVNITLLAVLPAGTSIEDVCIAFNQGEEGSLWRCEDEVTFFKKLSEGDGETSYLVSQEFQHFTGFSVLLGDIGGGNGCGSALSTIDWLSIGFLISAGIVVTIVCVAYGRHFTMTVKKRNDQLQKMTTMSPLTTISSTHETQE